MCVEPDGGVLPCQSYYHQLGNLLSDPWESIWNHELAVRLRERQGLPEKCSGCLLVAETSCEMRNDYLDRALVVPVLGLRDAAFFGTVA